MSQVCHPALHGGVLALGDDDAGPSVVDEDGRVAPVDLVVVLRDHVLGAADAACKEGRERAYTYYADLMNVRNYCMLRANKSLCRPL